MESRKVMKIRNSYFINIPLEVSKALGIVKGDRLRINHLPGLGVLLTQAQGADQVPTFKVDIDRLQRAADFIYEQLKGRLRDLDSNFITGLHFRIIDDLVRSGIFELKARVEKLESKSEVPNHSRAKILPLHKKKRSPD